MITSIRNKIHSLSLGARIVWVFVLTALVSMFLFTSSFKLLTDSNEERILPKLVADYARMLVLEIGLPADIEKAKIISQRTGLIISIEREQKVYSTHSGEIDTTLFNKDHAHEYTMEGYQVQSLFNHGKAYLKIIKGHENIYFMISFRDSPIKASLILIGFLILLSMLIYIAYRLVRYLIAPIHLIEKGVLNFSKGELDYRIKKIRHDDLGVLTEHINDMAQQLSGILESKRQLLLAISHEVRTPLTKMNIALDLPNSQKNKDRIKESINQIENLLAEILESEKLKNNHSLNLEKVSVNEVIFNLIEEEYKEISLLQLDLTDQVSDIKIDVMRVRLLLRNLINNAIRYGLNKPIKIETNTDKNNMIIKISDQGEGIEASNIEHVFEAFYREDQARQRQTGGTGLGLYLVKQIIDAHHGEILIESEKNIGTQVTIKFNL